jgi:hypothetical protein
MQHATAGRGMGRRVRALCLVDAPGMSREKTERPLRWDRTNESDADLDSSTFTLHSPSESLRLRPSHSPHAAYGGAANCS